MFTVGVPLADSDIVGEFELASGIKFACDKMGNAATKTRYIGHNLLCKFSFVILSINDDEESLSLTLFFLMRIAPAVCWIYRYYDGVSYLLKT